MKWTDEVNRCKMRGMLEAENLPMSSGVNQFDTGFDIQNSLLFRTILRYQS